MRLLQMPRRSRRDISPRQCSERMRASEQRASTRLDQTEARHDAHMLCPRPAPVDPYAAWLEQRERDESRARKSPHDAWDDLRTEIFVGTAP